MCLALSLLSVIAYVPAIVGLPFTDGMFSQLERMWHHSSFEWRANKLHAGDERLLVLAVDDKAIGELGFPLPRNYYTKALNEMTRLGAKVVIFDVLFLEPREGDKEFSEAMRRHGGVINLYTASITGESKGKVVVRRPVPILEKASKALGCPIIDRHIDLDGRVRTLALFDPEIGDPVRGSSAPLTSVAAAAISLYTGRSLEELQEKYPTEDGLFLMLNYRRPRTWPMELDPTGVPIYTPPYIHISILDLVKGRLTPEQKKFLKGAIVIVGSTTTGYYDHYPTPFSSQAPRAEYHLNVIDNIINKDALPGTDIPNGILLTFLMAWVPYFLLPFAPVVGAVIVAILLAGMFGGSLMLMSHNWVLYPVSPGLTLLASFLAVNIYRVLTEGAAKKAIMAKFGQFVSPEIVEELAKDPEKAKLGAQKREMTVFFLDIAHFTTISEKMSAEALMTFLNRYLSAFSEVILDRNGTIDKFIGDCVVAFWNAPIENKDHARDAVLSALQCQVAIAELNKNLDPGIPEIPQIRIGINTGFMNVGFTGTERKLAYTVIGDQVNLASRLEGANKFFGSQIMISEPTYQAAKHAVSARYLGQARVVGKETPVPVYEPLAEKGKLSAAWVKAMPVWEKGIKAFYAKKYDEALSAFEEFSKLMPGDGPGELYLGQSRDYAALPPDDWDQVFNLTAK
jgi:adenylate cyclase